MNYIFYAAVFVAVGYATYQGLVWIEEFRHEWRLTQRRVKK